MSRTVRGNHRYYQARGYSKVKAAVSSKKIRISSETSLGGGSMKYMINLEGNEGLEN